MAELAKKATRASALDGHVPEGHIGEVGATGVTLTVTRDVQLWQVAAWANSHASVARQIQAITGSAAPGPCRAGTGANGTALRIEPLKWWLFGCEAPALASADGAIADLSHARTVVTLDGPDAAACLMRHLPLDLRDEAFPVGSVASSALHHVGVTVWRSDAGYVLFLPRGFALSLWELLLETAAQFGAEARFA